MELGQRRPATATRHDTEQLHAFRIEKPLPNSLTLSAEYLGTFSNSTSPRLGKEGRMAKHTGLWYDAVIALSDMIEAAPNNGLLRKQRAALMQQVGLPEIAKYDLNYAKAH